MTSSVSSSPEPLFKKRRNHDQKMRWDPQMHVCRCSWQPSLTFHSLISALYDILKANLIKADDEEQQNKTSSCVSVKCCLCCIPCKLWHQIISKNHLSEYVSFHISKMRMTHVSSGAFSWQSYMYETVSADDLETYTANGLLEQINVTRDALNYLWYLTGVNIQPNERFLKNKQYPVLAVMSAGYALQVFINGQLSGSPLWDNSRTSGRLIQVPSKCSCASANIAGVHSLIKDKLEINTLVVGFSLYWYWFLQQPSFSREQGHAWTRRSWRVGEEYARTVTSAIGRFASTELPLQRAVLPPILQLLIDSNHGVREAAMSCIEVLLNTFKGQPSSDAEGNAINLKDEAAAFSIIQLTSSKLKGLELKDPSFRCHVPVQALFCSTIRRQL
ncbi:hypothetical protein Vadar_027693 [Vaccinium darrowii]|uniref:Uncharacterized protein n=1 Tax=Vaccinium darrowii TaxID=229202 RepID=A0ACB7X494_9ERIC|nr:hypothetical protein Vadar_027693 [Vaccinium darrowii]